MLKEWSKIKEKLTDKERKRLDICNGCEFKTYSSWLAIIKGEDATVTGYYCNKCKCPLIAKLKTKNKKHICEKW